MQIEKRGKPRFSIRKDYTEYILYDKITVSKNIYPVPE